MTIEELVNRELGDNAKVISQIKTTNNKVFIIKYQDKDYILKFYQSKSWPEKDKVLYVNQLLQNNNVRFPQILLYKREDFSIDKGFIIEEKIKGTSIDIENLNEDDGVKYYKKLAQLMNNVYKPTFNKYGYLDFGNPYFNSLSDYCCYILKKNITELVANSFVKIKDIDKFIKNYEDKLSKYNCYKATLIHGDLSLRNVIKTEIDDLVLIDWDDAMALPKEADIARLTFDMKFWQNYDKFRKAFLDEIALNQEEFAQFEKLYHIFVACDWLVFSVDKGKEDDFNKEMLKYLNCLLKEENLKP